MAKNRIFFPQEALDTWLLDGHVELSGEELTIKAEGRKFRIAEAVRVLTEVTGTPDGFDLVGRVKSKGYLTELGAEMLDSSMILGDNAYDVTPGFLGMPIGSFAAHIAEVARRSDPSIKPADLPPKSDEELLGQFLLRVL
jgi:hypothetical protein